MTFDEVLVPLDLSATADRALPVARSLAGRLDLPLDLVTVSSPFEDESVAHRLLAHRLEATRGVAASCTVLRGEVVQAITQRATEAAAVLCLSTHGRGVLGRTVLGSVAVEVLGVSDGPVVLVGPNVDVSRFGEVRSLLVVTDGSLQLLPHGPIAWLAQRLGVAVRVVAVHELGGVLAPGTLLDETTFLDHVDELCGSFRAMGLSATPMVVRDQHATTALTSITGSCPSPLLVVVSGRAGRPDRHHVVAALARDASAPVVAVPRVVVHAG